MIKVSAPGKLMLFGEHAVVHGRPSIVTAVNHRMGVKVEKRNDDKIVLEAPDVDVHFKTIRLEDLNREKFDKGSCFVIAAIKEFFKKYGVESGLHIETKSEFSSKIGFGSSSAVTVSMIKALSELFGIKMKEREIFDLSYKVVLDVQGVGSGFDVAAATYGGTLFFVTGGKIIDRINIDKIPLIVGYTGIKADTPTMVRYVEEKKRKYPDLVEPLFNLHERIVLSARECLEEKDFEKLGEMMNFSHGLSVAAGVSSRELEKLIYAARLNGAYGAKLSGAGGGDCMIAVSAIEKEKSVIKSIEKVGGIIIPVETNVEGVRVENV